MIPLIPSQILDACFDSTYEGLKLGSFASREAALECVSTVPMRA